MLTVRQVAAWLNVTLPATADADLEVISVSSAGMATPSSIVFATDSKTLGLALHSGAGVILATEKCASDYVDKRLLLVTDARLAFAQVALLLEQHDSTTAIHATAIVDLSAFVGNGTRIAAHSVVGKNAVIGDNCTIGPNVTIHPKTKLGNRVNVQAGAVLGSQGFGYARNSEDGRYILFPQQGVLVIEDDVDIGANTTIDRGALGETRIGAGSKLDNLVHIGHNCVIGQNVIIAAQTGISGSSVVEDGAILGGQVGIGEHALVGSGVILGGGAGVLSGKKMQGPGEVFWGRPARPLREHLKDLARLKRR